MKGPWLTLTLAGLVLAVSGAGELLQLDRAALTGGQVWRLLTAHLVHFGSNHLLWDLVMFVLLGGIGECIDRRQFVKTLIASALAITMGIFLLLPAIAHYRGLSGIDSALFGFLACILLVRGIREKRTIPVLLVGGLIAAFALKIIFEIRFGMAVFADSIAGGFVPVPLAHLIGMLVGMVFAMPTPKQSVKELPTLESVCWKT